MAQGNVYYSRRSHFVKASHLVTDLPPQTMILILQSVYLHSDTQIFLLKESRLRQVLEVFKKCSDGLKQCLLLKKFALGESITLGYWLASSDDDSHPPRRLSLLGYADFPPQRKSPFSASASLSIVARHVTSLLKGCFSFFVPSNLLLS